MMASEAQSTESKQQWIEQQKIVFLCRNTPFSAIASALVILSFSWAQRDFIMQNQIAQLWFVASLIVTALRISHVLVRKQIPGLFSDRLWLLLFRFLAFIAGLLYGLLIFVFFEHSSTSMQATILFLSIAVPASAIATLGIDRIAYLNLLLTTIGPTAFYLYWLADASYHSTAGLVLIFAFAFERISRRIVGFLLQNIEMTYAMRYRATHDPLVGLLNRGELEHQFDLRAPLSKRAIAMIFLDLDNFKPLNDTLGHQRGDQALIEVAKIIKQQTRADDITARLGGDEFLVILFLDTASEAVNIAMNIAEQVTHLSFGEDYSGLTTSIGICFHGDTDVSFSRMLRIADLALYESKEYGKNEVTLLHYDSEQFTSTVVLGAGGAESSTCSNESA